MKSLVKYRIALVAVCTFLMVCANAQRPVWLIGHGANWGDSAEKLLNQGGNGVEIDVRCKGIIYGEDTKGQHWSVAHDMYWPKSECDGKYQYSLEQYLQLNALKDPRFCLLWIDCKNDEYLKELVEYVHKYIPSDAKYAIVYNAYSKENVRKNIEWLADNLKPNEGLNFANLSIYDDDCLYDFLRAYDFPANQHFFTRGIFSLALVGRDSDARKDLTKANELKADGEFCSRTGAWTGDNGHNSYWFLDSEYAGRPTDVDLVLAYFSGGWRLPFTKKAVKHTRKNYIDNPLINKGKMRMAVPQDVFFPIEVYK